MAAVTGSFLNLPDRLPPADALHLSQQAPSLLQQPSWARSTFRLPFGAVDESPEAWTAYEHLFLSCLRTRDDKSAHLCLERLSNRFGPSDPRIMSLRGLYQEAVAENGTALTQILRDYERVLSEDPINTVRS